MKLGTLSINTYQYTVVHIHFGHAPFSLSLSEISLFVRLDRQWIFSRKLVHFHWITFFVHKHMQSHQLSLPEDFLLELRPFLTLSIYCLKKIALQLLSDTRCRADTNTFLHHRSKSPKVNSWNIDTTNNNFIAPFHKTSSNQYILKQSLTVADILWPISFLYSGVGGLFHLKNISHLWNAKQ